MNATTPKNSIRSRSRSEQWLVFKELRASSAQMRKLNFLHAFSRSIGYMLLFYFIGLPLFDRIGVIGCGLVMLVLFTVFEELVWRLVWLPSLDKELQRQIKDV